MLNRELSWLSFNERVLQEAQNTDVPLIERFRFLGIYSNNLDEFFRVRVANVKRLISAKKTKIEGFDGSPAKLLDEIRSKVIKQQTAFEICYKSLLESLEKEGIYQLQDEKSLNKAQRKELFDFFHVELKHAIVPIILKSTTTFPKLQDQSIYLAVKMQTSKKPIFALVELPPYFPRFYQFKTNGENNEQYFMLLDDIIRINLEYIFNIFDFTHIEAYTFKFTRDAELNLDDDFSISFVEKIEKSLKNRKKGEPVRFVYDQNMPNDLKTFLLKSLNLKSTSNAIPGGRYHNFKDFNKFPNFGRKELVYQTQNPVLHTAFDYKKSLIQKIIEKDILVHFPYQTFDYVVDVLREAAIDPLVKTIKINIYRVTRNSQILSALMNAVSNGKEVVVFFELQARFDEENNIIWSERLKEHGAKVIYGFKDLKVHSKLFQITRHVRGQEQFITYIGTGNFHEGTARVYTDLGFFTAHQAISIEVKKVFRILENSLERGTYKHLIVSPFNSRRKIYSYIQQEINHVKAGNKGLIQIKINNLVDAQVIQKLYHASKMGVKIQLIVRGVCCIIPGIKGKSDNIEIISIVGRYLEHTRFMIFHNNGKPNYYITSADLMERNLDKRIEVGVPILDESLQRQIQFIFDTQWRDNQKARIIDKKLKNEFRPFLGEKHSSQLELYQQYKSKIDIDKI